MHEIIMSDNGFVTIDVRNECATAKIALQGAHIFEYTRYAEPPLLWVSSNTLFEQGKAIRGGIPVCWPWFGKDSNHSQWPQHGFARTALWKLKSVTEPSNRQTEIILTLNHTQVKQHYFPYLFDVMMHITVSDTLTVSLCTENLDEKPFTVTEALHTYFNVGNIAAVNIFGLENVTYADALDRFRKKQSAKPIAITQEIDRVYLDTDDIVIIKDARYGRDIIVGKSGSRSTVVWNPWIDKAARMADFEDEGYASMVCIETANALENSITIEPGQSHTITQTIQ